MNLPAIILALQPSDQAPSQMHQTRLGHYNYLSCLRASIQEKFSLMRYYTALLTIVTLVLFGFAGWQMQERNASPDVHVVGGGVYDSGTIPAGVPLMHIFTVENPHSFALGLGASAVGCACTTVTVSASTIPPHGTAEVTLRVEPEDGKFSGSASIITTHKRKSTKTWLIATGKSLPLKTRTARKS